MIICEEGQDIDYSVALLVQDVLSPGMQAGRQLQVRRWVARWVCRQEAQTAHHHTDKALT